MSHLRKELIEWKATGHLMSKVNEQHFANCGSCRALVESAEKEIAIQSMKKTKPTPNKMGRSHPYYLKAIS
jgi:hypothetical protein